MKTVNKYFVILVIMIFSTQACSKGGRYSLDLFPTSVGFTPLPFRVNLHRTNSYPANCNIELNFYRSTDTISFIKQNSLKFRCPTSDSTINEKGSWG